MRENIRREVRHFDEAGWWLVPIAFAIAALAAVAVGAHNGDDGAPQSHAAATVPATQLAPAVASPAAAKPQQPEEPAYEVEHVQAF